VDVPQIRGQHRQATRHLFAALIPAQERLDGEAMALIPSSE